ncbi:MAG: amidase [Acidobacteriota bacterium]
MSARSERFPVWWQLSPAAQGEIASHAADRARQLEQRLHAFVKIEDASSRASRTGPLAAMPYAVKDMFAAPGHDPDCGLASPGNLLLDGDADVLSRLDAAGACRIGFTRMTELAYEPSGFNAVTEYARNPWNLDFIPGGSSSGSAVAVASGSVVFAVGSDTGGSIRVPAHCCGVTGWKPTWGSVSVAGALPLAPFLDSVGLLARSALELAPVAEAISANAHPRTAIERIVVLRDAVNEAEDAIRSGCDDGIEALRASGAAVSYVDGLSAIQAIDVYALRVMQGEALRTHAGRLDDPAIDAVLRTRLLKGHEIDEAMLFASRAARARLAEDFEERILGKADAAVLPVMPIRTPPFSEVDPSSPSFSARRLYALSSYCRFVNMLGFPAIAFPVGFDNRGMPVGLQMVARPGRDGDLIALAAKMQEKTGWHGRIPAAIRDLVDA